MKKILMFLILCVALIFAACSAFTIDYTANEITDGKGRPPEYYHDSLPSTQAFTLPNPVPADYILSHMNDGVFSSNELAAAVTANAYSALPNWTGRDSMSVILLPGMTAANKWAVTPQNFPNNLDAVYYFWADDSWDTYGTYQIDGGDYYGDWVNDAERRQVVCQATYAAEALEAAGYIADAVLAYYYCMVESWNTVILFGLPVTAYGEDGTSSWIVTSIALERLTILVGEYGQYTKALGVKYVGGKIDGIGKASETTWLYPSYDYNYGYFIPYSE